MQSLVSRKGSRARVPARPREGSQPQTRAHRDICPPPAPWPPAVPSGPSPHHGDRDRLAHGCLWGPWPTSPNRRGSPGHLPASGRGSWPVAGVAAPSPLRVLRSSGSGGHRECPPQGRPCLPAPPHGLRCPQSVGDTPSARRHQAHSALTALRRPAGVCTCVWLCSALCFPNPCEQRPPVSPNTCHRVESGL